MDNEPSLEQIEDYNDKESKEKRNTVKLVVLFCILVGIVFAVIKYNYQDVEEYVGTPDKPGINTSRSF